MMREMENKIIEKKSEIDYEQLKIKTYDFWDLYLHVSQFPYLGRCYA